MSAYCSLCARISWASRLSQPRDTLHTGRRFANCCRNGRAKHPGPNGHGSGRPRSSTGQPAGPYFGVWPALDDPALRLGEETVIYGELLLVGAETGLLESIGASTIRALRVLENELAEPSRDELQSQAVTFRRARRLESGEDLRSWLTRRQLTMTEWEGHLRRSVAAKSPDEPLQTTSSDQAFQESLAIDLACCGFWRQVADAIVDYWSAGRLATGAARELGSAQTPEDSSAETRDASAPEYAVAEQLTRRLAPFGRLDVDWCATRLRVLRWRQRALEEARQRFSSDAAVTGRIADHGADWTQFVFDSLCLPTTSAANEAAICARDDGIAPNEIARRAGRPLEHVQLRRTELPVGMAALLSGAQPGEALGPLESGEGVVVFWLRERRPPVDDPATRQEAASELLAEALDRAAAEGARTVGPL